jgi:hypothetical protein
MYGTKVRNVLDADPMTVDYRILCPYFYLFGLKLLEFIVDEALPGILEKVRQIRANDLMLVVYVEKVLMHQKGIQRPYAQDNEFCANIWSCGHWKRVYSKARRNRKRM